MPFKFNILEMKAPKKKPRRRKITHAESVYNANTKEQMVRNE